MSQANAVCRGDTPNPAATSDNVVDCSGEKPPSGKNGT